MKQANNGCMLRCVRIAPPWTRGQLGGGGAAGGADTGCCGPWRPLWSSLAEPVTQPAAEERPVSLPPPDCMGAVLPGYHDLTAKPQNK